MRKGWIEAHLHETAKVLNGFAFKSELFDEHVGMPLIRIRDLPNRKFTETRFKGDFQDQYVVRKGDFLIGMDGEFRCYEWQGKDALLNQRVCRIQDFKTELVDPRYLYLNVNGYLERIEADTGFTTVKHISAKQILEIKFPLPPLQEQKRIVDLISSVDSYIDALQHQADSARKSRNAVLHELLSAGGDGWTETTIGKVAKCAGGSAFPIVHQNSQIGIPFMKVSDMNIRGNEVEIISALNHITSELAKKLKVRVWPKDTVIFPKVGAALLTDKRRILTRDTIFDNNIMGLIACNIIIPRFLFLFMTRIRMSDYVQSGALPSISNGIVQEIEINLPPLQEQKRIVDLISSMDDAITTTEVTIAETKKLRSGLLSDLLSGDHEIPASYDKITGAA
jgi:type I restriction enzyme S subunit